MKINELLTEGFLADQQKGILATKTAVAAALKVPRHRVSSYRSDLTTAVGVKWLIAHRLPKDKQEDFYAQMFGKLVSRELSKQFPRWKLEKISLEKFGMDTEAIVRFYLPDIDGGLPD